MLVLDVSIAIDCFCTLSYFLILLLLLLLLTGFETLLPFFPKLSLIHQCITLLRTSLGISYPGLPEASRTS